MVKRFWIFPILRQMQVLFKKHLKNRNSLIIDAKLQNKSLKMKRPSGFTL